MSAPSPPNRSPTQTEPSRSPTQSAPSLFDELTDKLRKDPRLTKKGGPRVDLSLLLFNARDDLQALWAAAEQDVAAATREGRTSPLERAVEALRPLFGSRPAPRRG